MPTIATFYRLVIRMYFDEHPPPHLHASYGEYVAQVRIEDGEVLAGTLSRRAAAMVDEWMALHRGELLANWALAEQGPER